MLRGVLWRAGQAAPPGVGTEALPLRSLSGAGGASAQQHQVLPVSSQALARGSRHRRSGNSINVEARAGPEGNQANPGGEGQEGTAEETNVHGVTGGPQGQLEQDAWRAGCQDAVGSGHALLFWIPEVRRIDNPIRGGGSTREPTWSLETSPQTAWKSHPY